MRIPTMRVMAGDNCTPYNQLVFTQSPAAGTLLPGPCQVVTITVTDAAGNSTNCQRAVCGIDKTPPTLTCLRTLALTNCFVPDVMGYVSAYDACTPSNKLVFSA